MLHVRKVENRDSLYAQGGVIHGGVAARLYQGCRRMKFPLWIGKLTGSDNPVVNAVEIGTKLVDDFPVKKNGFEEARTSPGS